MIYDEVCAFYRHYRGKKCVIGYSCRGREIFAMHVGSQYGRQFISVGGVHGREWITAALSLKHIQLGCLWGGYVIPLLNPDGAVISQTSEPMWKANARGVDLNCNFPADWGQGRLNTRVRGAENCIGDYPLSEPESAALARFTRRVKPSVTFAFHTKGGEIYWEYGGRGDERGARIISECCGYAVKRITGSCGGYKDWCISSLGIASYTIECGSDLLSHPITSLSDISECAKIIRHFTENYEKK